MDEKTLSELLTKIEYAIRDYENSRFTKEDMRIYMPLHTRRAIENLNIANTKRRISGFAKIFGIEVLLGYENKIVISILDGFLKNIEPIKIDIE